jgi:hypothetical protein
MINVYHSVCCLQIAPGYTNILQFSWWRPMAKIIITHLDFKDPDSYPKDPQNIMCQIRSAGGVLDYSTTCPTFRATESVRPGGICASNELAHVLDLHFEIARGPRCTFEHFWAQREREKPNNRQGLCLDSGHSTGVFLSSQFVQSSCSWWRWEKNQNSGWRNRRNGSLCCPYDVPDTSCYSSWSALTSVSSVCARSGDVQ